MPHIVLIGFMGCGKTTVGKQLSKQLSLPFVDTDEWIEKEQGIDINTIFAQYGEPYFRELETQVLKRLCENGKPHVISAGGGLPVQQQNLPYLKKIGEVIYLKANADSLEVRLAQDTKRPLLKEGRLRERIDTLLHERETGYEEAATHIIDTNSMDVGKILEKIVEILE